MAMVPIISRAVEEKVDTVLWFFFSLPFLWSGKKYLK